MERYIKFAAQCKDCMRKTKCMARDTCKGCVNRRADKAGFTCFCALNAERWENACPRYEKGGADDEARTAAN